MNLSTAIYLAEIISSVKIALLFCLFISVILMAICLICYIINESWNETEDDRCECISKISLAVLRKYWIVLIFIFTMVLTPSKKSMYLMIGAKYLSASNLPAKVEKVLTLKMNHYINELQGKNK